MYYSKTSPSRHGERITVPQNYSGNAFRVKDESERRRYEPAPSSDEETRPTEAPFDIAPQAEAEGEENEDRGARTGERGEDRSAPVSASRSGGGGLLSSLFQGTSLEDVLLIALTFMILQDETNDDVLLLLIILLFLK